MSGEGLLAPHRSMSRISADRKAREARAKERAASLPAGDYHAANSDVVNSETRAPVLECESHWDACLVLLAIGGNK